jgi:hypothetical protein
MDITTLLGNTAPGHTNYNIPGGLGGPSQMPSTDYASLLGERTGEYGGGQINYAQTNGATAGYDASSDPALKFTNSAMNGNASTGDFTAMFESFQTRMTELFVKALKALGLPDDKLVELLDSLTNGQGQKALQAFGGEGAPNQESGTTPSGNQPVLKQTSGCVPGGAQSPHSEPTVIPPLPQTATAPTQPAATTPITPTPTTPTSGESVQGEGGLHLPPALENYRGAILNAAETSTMPAEVIAGMIWAESRGNLSAQTTNGGNGLADSGLMQINSNTFAELKAKYPKELGNADVNNADDNIMAGALYLKDQHDAFGGNMGAALRAYNSGPNNVNVNDLSDISKTNTGNPNYVDYVTGYAHTIKTGEGQLPA